MIIYANHLHPDQKQQTKFLAQKSLKGRTTVPLNKTYIDSRLQSYDKGEKRNSVSNKKPFATFYIICWQLIEDY